ncbi:unnamed protein product [Porites evermanni]|uniref:Uncharacterized protein n=1 Tax=Porites evermanni TaxID=104178 RepID=A0ABN8LC70_9CNID|nr:unnamed protein product [Porites evermanni]
MMMTQAIQQALPCFLSLELYIAAHIHEPNLGPLEEVGSKQQSSCLEDISTQSAVVVILEFLGVNSMTHIEVTKELQPLAKKLNIKHRSLKK